MDTEQVGVVMRSIAKGRIALSGAIALLALISTAFLDAGADSAGNQGTIRLLDPGAGPWCVPTGELASGRGCRYSTFEECLTAVTGLHRTCRPNPRAVVVDEGPYWTYRPIYL